MPTPLRTLCAFLLAAGLAGPGIARAEYEGLIGGEEEEPPPQPPKKVAKAPPPVVRAEPEAAEPPYTLDASLALTSNYLWRGYDFSKGAVSLQPYVEADVALPFLSEASGLVVTLFTSTAIDAHTDVDDTQWGLLYRHALGEHWQLQAGYLLYVGPGTETLPNTNEGADPDDVDFGGELVAILALDYEPFATSLTYARGHRAYAGNSLNVFSEFWAETPVDGLTFGPYLQLDYSDQFGVAEQTDYPGFSQRLTSVEGGAQFEYALEALRFRAAGSLLAIPSQFVRVANEASGASPAGLRPWWSIGVAWVRE